MSILGRWFKGTGSKPGKERVEGKPERPAGSGVSPERRGPGQAARPTRPGPEPSELAVTRVLPRPDFAPEAPPAPEPQHQPTATVIAPPQSSVAAGEAEDVAEVEAEEELDDQIDDSFDRLFGGAATAEGDDGEESAFGGFDSVLEAVTTLESEDAEAAGSPAAAAHEPVYASTDDYIMQEALGIFCEIASLQVQPVKGFITELRYGPVAPRWVDICLPIITMLVQSAQGLGLAKAVAVLEEFRTLLVQARDEEAPLIDARLREMMLLAYGEMAAVLPKVFYLDAEELDDARREVMIVMGLLQLVPEVGRVNQDKLFSAGITTLEALYKARPNDLHRTTGIPAPICEKIYAGFQEYGKEVDEAEEFGEDAETYRWEKLGALVEELRQVHRQYKEASAQEWKDEDAARRKRKYRKQRERIAIRVRIALAELGLERIAEEFDRLPFERRLLGLDRYLKAVSEGDTP
ncbi:MAG: hypothetical protein HYV63_13225 [Candidatus Schekmanbacteria bacterium]|nr:hypothetical protein [Candidatus Schekmanbacteria bacterium]